VQNERAADNGLPRNPRLHGIIVKRTCVPTHRCPLAALRSICWRGIWHKRKAHKRYSSRVNQSSLFPADETTFPYPYLPILLDCNRAVGIFSCENRTAEVRPPNSVRFPSNKPLIIFGAHHGIPSASGLPNINGLGLSLSVTTRAEAARVAEGFSCNMCGQLAPGPVDGRTYRRQREI